MIFILLLCLAAAALLGGGLYAYNIAFRATQADKKKGPPALEGTIYAPFREDVVRMYRTLRDRPYEEVSIVSGDGLTLRGRYYHVKDGAPVSIGFHGYRSGPLTDFAGGSEMAFRMEHNLLLVHHRAHGESDGRTISFGIAERRDVLAWVNYVLERFGDDTKILLYGVSMGAATVLMAANLPLPENVKGIVADCPYARPLDIILHVGKSNPLPQWLIRPFVIFGAKVYGGFDLLEADCITSAAQTGIPILLIHGEDDDFVPTAMSEQIRQANPDKVQRHTFPGAGHAVSYLKDPVRYRQIVEDFARQVLMP